MEVRISVPIHGGGKALKIGLQTYLMKMAGISRSEL